MKNIRKKVLLSVMLTLMTVTSQAQNIPVYLDPNQPIEARVKDALSKMTLEEKVALCTAQSKFSSHGVPRLGIPELWMSDGSHGVREEISWDSWTPAGWTNDACTGFPALSCLAATWNPKMAALYGKSIGEEFRYRHKDIMLGPGINIYRTPLNGRNYEYMGEDPYLTSQLVVQYIQNVQNNGVAVCVKHYLLNNQETWRDSVDVQISDRALHEIYLPAWKAAVEKGHAWSIMGSYNKIRGEHGCESQLTLNKILKTDWGFDGAVVSDWGGAHSTMASALGGLDIEMGTWTNGMDKGKTFAYDDYYLGRNYLKALKEGSIPMSNINDKASRILRLIFRTAMNTNRPYGSFGSQEHLNAAREIADEGIVLLKNDNKKRLLPIEAKRYKNILVIGENAIKQLTSGGGAAGLKVSKEISPLSALQTKYGEAIHYTMGYASGSTTYGHVAPSPYSADSLRDEAVKEAQKADLIIYIGGLNKNFRQDCESGDRESLNLPFKQDQLIEALSKVNKNIILTLLSGNAMAMPWKEKIPAIIQGWYLGSEAGNSLVDILSGDVNPSGKLPFTFPVKLADVGAHSFDAESYPGVNYKEIYKEDIFVGYRWNDSKNITALFPFGYGLSYTTFKYGKATFAKNTLTQNGEFKISIPITNTGKIKGKEVVQLYIGEENPSVPRPRKELKGFNKIELAPGETTNITFKITPDMLSFYDDAQQTWRNEPGKFKAYIGSSSTDIKYTIEFTFK